jgi:outer membrane biosynthesis protein TonB
VETAPAPAPTPDARPTAPVQPQAARPQETTAQKITPQEAKPQDTKPQHAKPQDTKRQEAKLQEAKPHEVKPQDTKPKEVQPTPAALPKDLEIEDLLGQVTPRVEELLAGATRLIRIGDIRGAREVLAAPETAHSGALTFLLAETYDPNTLPATLKATLADPLRARALYRKARDLGEGRAQGRLDAL